MRKGVAVRRPTSGMEGLKRLSNGTVESGVLNACLTKCMIWSFAAMTNMMRMKEAAKSPANKAQQVSPVLSWSSTLTAPFPWDDLLYDVVIHGDAYNSLAARQGGEEDPAEPSPLPRQDPPPTRTVREGAESPRKNTGG